MDKNLENNIKYHFENRRINPNAAAWDKLDNALAQTDKRTPYIYRLNLKLTAAAVVLILFGLFLLNHSLLHEEKEEILIANTEVDLNTQISSQTTTGDTNTPVIYNTEKSNKKQLKTVYTSSSPIKLGNTHIEEIKHNQVSFLNETEKVENNAELSHKAIQEVTNHNHQAEFIDFKMVDPQKLLSDTESALTLKSKQDMVNKYDIDPNKLLKEAEKEANRSYLLRAIKSVKEISSPMISAVMSRNEIKAE